MKPALLGRGIVNRIGTYRVAAYVGSFSALLSPEVFSPIQGWVKEVFQKPGELHK